ncbi:formate hydrogenlyase [bacterium]|nr:formate hydrogenlyase [bacterium]
MTMLISIAVFALSLSLLPFLILGVISSLKARWQNRRGASVLQPFRYIKKLYSKQDLSSKEASWISDLAPPMILASALLMAIFTPWLSFSPLVQGSDLFLVVYLFGLSRFFTILAALDSGSPLTGFGASREATLSILTEPALVLSLLSLAITAGSTDLNKVFAFSQTAAGGVLDVAIWSLAAATIFLTALIDLSRMPVDDPTTHLELTMIHESMVIEFGGRRMAMILVAYALRMVTLLGLASQCAIHALIAIPALQIAPMATIHILSIIGILAGAVAIALVETFFVKLKWTRVPEFIAYAVTLSLLGCGAALLGGGI